jgi:hypothetical protein
VCVIGVVDKEPFIGDLGGEPALVTSLTTCNIEQNISYQ